MRERINFHHIFTLLREWFDTPTPRYDDFEAYRFQLYDEYSSGSPPTPSLAGSTRSGKISQKPLLRLPLKTWWPHYTDGDYRFELCIGALLVHQTSWRQVEKAIKGIEHHLVESGKRFNSEGITDLPLEELESLIRSTGFYRQKARRVHGFSRHIVEKFGSISQFMEWGKRVGEEAFGSHLRSLGLGFGNETRDSVLLYAANFPVFIADAYARKLLTVLGLAAGSIDYYECQSHFIRGIEGDFSKADIRRITEEYSPEERAFVLVNEPKEEDIPTMLLYQLFHAGIDELGISKRWDEFRDELRSRY